MNYEVLTLGPLQNNVYIIGDDTSVVVVDPSRDVDTILEHIGDRNVEAIILTHSHWDHCGVAAALREATGAITIAHSDDTPGIETGEDRAPACKVDRIVTDGDTLNFVGARWTVLSTPGHTPGSTCYLVEYELETPILITGDTLFKGTHGRTDFEGGDPQAMEYSLKQLAQLPPETIVLPGHNEPSTIGEEQGWINA